MAFCRTYIIIPCCSNQFFLLCNVLLPSCFSSLVKAVAIVVCERAYVRAIECSRALQWGDGMWNHWHYRHGRGGGVSTMLLSSNRQGTVRVAHSTSPLSTFRSVQLSFCHRFSPHLHPHTPPRISLLPPRSSPSNNSTSFSLVLTACMKLLCTLWHKRSTSHIFHVIRSLSLFLLSAYF